MRNRLSAALIAGLLVFGVAACDTAGDDTTVPPVDPAAPGAPADDPLTPDDGLGDDPALDEDPLVDPTE